MNGTKLYLTKTLSSKDAVIVLKKKTVKEFCFSYLVLAVSQIKASRFDNGHSLYISDGFVNFIGRVLVLKIVLNTSEIGFVNLTIVH